MDNIAQYNIERWARLVDSGAIFTRPYLDLTPASARAMLDPDGRFGDVYGKRALCLASGGGQQSVAFALLGASVTVIDLSPAQVQRDVEAAAHHRLSITALQGDMRDLSQFEPASFDLVYHPYSVNFVPDANIVFREVARVVRVNGVYHLNCANPFASGLTTRDWNGEGYVLKLPYVDGAEITYHDESWVFRGEQPTPPVNGPKEYRHTLSTLINGLVEHGFVIEHVAEEHFGVPSIDTTPGTAEHLSAVVPPWLRFWTRYRPNVNTL